MKMGSGPIERLRQLEMIEREIATAIHSSGKIPKLPFAFGFCFVNIYIFFLQIFFLFFSDLIFYI